MSRLPIIGEYPPDWKQISDATWAAAGHRCIRCAHPYKKGENGKGEWSPCDDKCNHFGPLGARQEDGAILALSDHRPGAFKGTGLTVAAVASIS